MEFKPIFVTQNHFIDPKEKTDIWAAKMMNEYYWYGGANNLLLDKNVSEIESYAAGKQDVKKYKKMFKRMAKEQDQADAFKAGNPQNLSSIGIKDITGIDWQSLGFLVQPLNSALAVLEKMPIYVKCTAIDALAREKKEKDYSFLKNRPFLDGQLSDISKKLGSPITSPSAPNNAESVDISNFDLDPTKEDELNFYINLFYKLRPESAFEALLLALAYVLDMKKLRDREDRDQLLFGASSNQCIFSDMTGLPSVKYIYPGKVFTPDSDLPDFNDQDFRYLQEDLTASELMDRLGDEISEMEITELFDGYYKQQGWDTKWSDEKDILKKKRATVPVTYMEFKSWDTLRIHKKKGRNYFINDLVDFNYQLRYPSNHPNPKLRSKPKPPTPEDFLTRKVVQNTYTGYWFSFSPDRVYKYKILEGATREKGKESLSPFSINIWKSQEKSDVEMCIPFVDDAQRASFKMQHAIIMSKPKGIYVDLRYMRNTFNSLKTTDYPMTFKDLLSLLMENNVFLGDSEGVDPNELLSGSRPFYDIAGGVGQEIEGYLLVIKNSLDNIARITGWNDALTGQTANDAALVGIQKLMLQSAVNSLYHAQTAQKNQTEKIMRTWAHQCQYILKFPSSPSGRALESIMSSYKVDVIRDLKTIPLHQFGIMIENAPTEEQQADLNNVLIEMFKSQQITPTDYFTIRRVFNYKDAQQLLAIRQKKMQAKTDQAKAQEQKVALAIASNKEQSAMQQTQTKEQGRIQNTITAGQVQKWLAQFGGNLALQLEQIRGGIKTDLQRERMQGQLDKAQRTINANQQLPLPAPAA